MPEVSVAVLPVISSSFPVALQRGVGYRAADQCGCGADIVVVVCLGGEFNPPRAAGGHISPGVTVGAVGVGAQKDTVVVEPHASDGAICVGGGGLYRNRRTGLEDCSRVGGGDTDGGRSIYGVNGQYLRSRQRPPIHAHIINLAGEIPSGTVITFTYSGRYPGRGIYRSGIVLYAVICDLDTIRIQPQRRRSLLHRGNLMPVPVRTARNITPDPILGLINVKD